MKQLQEAEQQGEPWARGVSQDTWLLGRPWLFYDLPPVHCFSGYCFLISSWKSCSRQALNFEDLDYILSLICCFSNNLGFTSFHSTKKISCIFDASMTMLLFSVFYFCICIFYISNTHRKTSNSTEGEKEDLFPDLTPSFLSRGTYCCVFFLRNLLFHV